jgi:hypothetical protein
VQLQWQAQHTKLSTMHQAHGGEHTTNQLQHQP